MEAWLDEEAAETIPQTGEGELLFLPSDFSGKLLHSDNTLTLSARSLDTGWVELRQCYHGLDAVPAAEVVYRYKEMRDLRIASHRNIANATAQGQSVQLTDVGHDATLCVLLEARILYSEPDGNFVLHNGPFHRRFLDGYFPLHVTLEVRYPAELLQYVGTTPVAQKGFEVTSREGLVRVDSRFAGMLNIAISFRAVIFPDRQ